MAIVLGGFRAFHGRAVAMLRQCADLPPELGARRDRLVAALTQVPFAAARTFYEAMVAEGLVFYLDGCDDLGRFDQDLIGHYRASLAAGETTAEDALELIGELWANIDCNFAWNVAIGGTAPDGGPGANELTRLCLRAARGRRRPNLALRIRRDTPQTVWDEALETIRTGCGLPALYCEENYQAALRGAHLGVSEADLPDFAFGGCTELMVHGKSNCGSLDADLNVPLVLDAAIRRHLAGCDSFEAFYDRFAGAVAEAITELCDRVSADQAAKAAHQPQVVRSLLIDDCIDSGIEYNAGGARYNWSVINVGGIGNTADSLHALREVVFDGGEISPAAMVEALAADFAGREDLRRRLLACAKYGNGDDRVDALARRVCHRVFEALLARAPWRGGKFLASCLMFTTYGQAGEPVGALPDGRKAGQPIADSAGAVQGRDTHGPTAMLRSVASIPHHLAPGTLVVNARFGRAMFDDDASRAKLQQLIRTYFDLGGMQLQINVVDQDTLRAALADPEAHGDLIVRVGGYSEYWGHLDEALRRSILERVEHT